MEAVEPLVKKRWRVGTLSMSVSLISLGLTLFISSWQGVTVFDMLIKLWPIIFVLLGCEILLYLFLSRTEKPILHSEQMILKTVDVARTETIGKTIYVLIKELPAKRGFERNQPVSSMILVVPQAIPIEVRDAYNNSIADKV